MKNNLRENINLPNFWNWNGFKVCWSVSGENNKIPIIFLHGFGASRKHWRNNLEYFAKRNCASYSLDLIGFGDSDQPGIKQIGILNNEIHLYNLVLYNSLKMVTSIANDDLFTFYDIYEKFDKFSWFFILLTFQLFMHLLYPTHEGHEISNWLLGAMTGWFLGASNLEISSNNFVKFFLSLMSTSAVFFMMIFLFQLDELVKLSGLMSILYSYSLGLFFSIFVSWIIPRFWKFFNLILYSFEGNFIILLFF